MIVHVVPFARIREIIGEAGLERDVAARATPDDVWDSLAADFPALRDLRASTRFVRNGAFARPDATLDDGDELGLLPPFGGG